jgi:hypothetical protein
MEQPKAKAEKVYKLAKGVSVDLPKAGLVKVTNESLKNEKVIELIKRKCPDVIGTLIVLA